MEQTNLSEMLMLPHEWTKMACVVCEMLNMRQTRRSEILILMMAGAVYETLHML